jgi:hypothetical protein
LITYVGNDFQHQNFVSIEHLKKEVITHNVVTFINQDNLISVSVYFAVRKCIEATWINDRDQFLFPKDGWEIDEDFQNNCLTYTLFSNNIQSKYGDNHWIPFTEKEVNAQEKLDSNFMTHFINGKLKNDTNTKIDIFSNSKIRTTPLIFSAEALSVFNAGKELWKYYHQQPRCNVNASLYDIREHFQGRNSDGRMNNKSEDSVYMQLITSLRYNLEILAKEIEPKIYEYGFLKD